MARETIQSHKIEVFAMPILERKLHSRPATTRKQVIASNNSCTLNNNEDYDIGSKKDHKNIIKSIPT